MAVAVSFSRVSYWRVPCMMSVHGGHANGWDVWGCLDGDGARNHRRAELGPGGTVSMESGRGRIRAVFGGHADSVRDRGCRGALSTIPGAEARADDEDLIEVRHGSGLSGCL
jgi:hypothetical protein